MEKTRHFIVDTPVGQLAIYAKHDKTDCAADYPGVFIDYVRNDVYRVSVLPAGARNHSRAYPRQHA